MIKKHYIFRNGTWWEFKSLAAAREFLATAQLTDGYRYDLQPIIATNIYYPRSTIIQ